VSALCADGFEPQARRYNFGLARLFYQYFIDNSLLFPNDGLGDFYPFLGMNNLSRV
jgi:hypothetical protein